jgi:hypothetical protein
MSERSNFDRDLVSVEYRCRQIAHGKRRESLAVVREQIANRSPSK